MVINNVSTLPKTKKGHSLLPLLRNMGIMAEMWTSQLNHFLHTTDPYYI